MNTGIKTIEPAQIAPIREIVRDDTEFRQGFDKAARMFAEVADRYPRATTARALNPPTPPAAYDDTANKLAGRLEDARKKHLLAPDAAEAYDAWRKSGNRRDLYRALRLHNQAMQKHIERVSRSEFEKINRRPATTPSA